ncbi:YfbU family protein [Luteococcus sp. H91]
MAIVNVRIDDHYHALLRERAATEGQSLSEFIRDRLIAAVEPVRPPDDSDVFSPDSLTLVERQQLALLHRILARVIPEDSSQEDGNEEDQLKLARVLEDGFVGGYSTEFISLRPELTKSQCSFVMDVLDMFRIITFSLDDLDKTPEEIAEYGTYRLEFQGFDHNDLLEGRMASYVQYLTSEGRWTELSPQIQKADNGNSHSPMLGVYERMLAEYRRVRSTRPRGFDQKSYLLNAGELAQLAESAAHLDSL